MHDIKRGVTSILLSLSFGVKVSCLVRFPFHGNGFSVYNTNMTAEAEENGIGYVKHS